MVTQLTKFVRLYSCNEVNLKMSGMPAETYWWEHCDEMHHKQWRAVLVI